MFDVELIGIRGKGKYANKSFVFSNTLLLHKQHTGLRDLNLREEVDNLVNNSGSGEILLRRREFGQDIQHPRGRIGHSRHHRNTRLRNLHRLPLRPRLQVLLDEPPPPHQRPVFLRRGLELPRQSPSPLPPGPGTAAVAASFRSASAGPRSPTQIATLPAIEHDEKTHVT